MKPLRTAARIALAFAVIPILATLSGCLLAGSLGPSVTMSTGDEPLVNASVFGDAGKKAEAAAQEGATSETLIIKATSGVRASGSWEIGDEEHSHTKTIQNNAPGFFGGKK